MRVFWRSWEERRDLRNRTKKRKEGLFEEQNRKREPNGHEKGFRTWDQSFSNLTVKIPTSFNKHSTLFLVLVQVLGICILAP